MYYGPVALYYEIKLCYVMLCMPSGVFCLSLWTGAFPFEGVSGLFLVLPFIIVIPVLKANSVDPDQMLQIWVYSVCEGHFCGTLGINGLNFYMIAKQDFRQAFLLSNRSCLRCVFPKCLV